MRSKPLEDWRPSFGWVGVGVQWGNSFAYVTSFKFVAWDFDGSLAHMFPPYLGISRLVRVWFSSFRVSRSEMRSSESSAFCFPNPTLTNQSRAVRRFLHLKISVEEHRNRNKICRILLTLLVKACISRHKTTISSSLEDSFCSVWVRVCSVWVAWSAKLEASRLKEHSSKCWRRLSFWSNKKVAPHPRGHRSCNFPMSLRTWYAGKAGYFGFCLHIGHLASCLWHSFQQPSQKIQQHLCITASLHTCKSAQRKIHTTYTPRFFAHPEAGNLPSQLFLRNPESWPDG